MRQLLAALLGLFAVVTSGTALTKHGHEAAVELAADQDAQAVIDAAEKASQSPEAEAQPQATQLSASSTADAAAQKKDESEDEEDDSDDDEGDEDDEKSTGAPGSVVAIENNPGEGKTTHVTYGVNDGVLRGESLTPQGRLTKARQRLQDNLYQQTKINSLIWQMQNETTFQGQVDAEAKDLATETQAQALATMLGGMRKEMRKFASPFFLDHLYSERQRLKAQELELQADLEGAEGGMGGGHQGWPHPGDKVVVAESVFRRPASLRGSEEEASDSEVKELKVSIPKETSLAQMKSQPHSQPEKSAAAALSRVGGLTMVATLACRFML